MVNEIALYSQGVYPIRDLYAMTLESIFEVRTAMIEKAEAERQALDIGKTTKTF